MGGNGKIDQWNKWFEVIKKEACGVEETVMDGVIGIWLKLE